MSMDTQISARAHRKLLATDSTTLTPVAGGVKENTNREKEWTYINTLPHDLTVLHPDSRQCISLYRRSSSSRKIMPEVANMDRDPTDDKEMPLGSMGWCGVDKPMDPCRDTIATELGRKGLGMILEQSRVHGTNHPGGMMGTADMILNPTGSYTPEMKAESGMWRQKSPDRSHGHTNSLF